MKVLLNGIDYSRLFYRYGLSEQPQKRYGSNGGDMLSGDKKVDLLAVKSRVALTCNPLTTAERDALKAVCAEEYVTLVYNPGGDSDHDVRITAIPSMSASSIKLVAGGKAYWTGLTITLEEV